MGAKERLSKLSNHLNIKSIKFDVDLEKIYLITTLGPCLKTKSWDYFIPIYGNYEAMELTSDLADTYNLNIIILDKTNSTDEILQFYRQEFFNNLLKWNAKISYMEYQITAEDRKKYGLV